MRTLHIHFKIKIQVKIKNVISVLLIKKTDLNNIVMWNVQKPGGQDELRIVIKNYDRHFKIVNCYHHKNFEITIVVSHTSRSNLSIIDCSTITYGAAPAKSLIQS